MAETRLVRIRPSKKGFTVKRYTYKSTIYDAERGWYEVPLHLANELEKLHQDHYDEDSPMLFDVVTRDKAVQIEESEKEALERAPATNPNQVEGRRKTIVTRDGMERTSGDLTTADLPANQPREGAMLDPDPEGLAVAEASDTGEGVVAVGKVSDEESNPTDARGRIRHRSKRET